MLCTSAQRVIFSEVSWFQKASIWHEYNNFNGISYVWWILCIITLQSVVYSDTQIHADLIQCTVMCELKIGLWEQGRVRKGKEADVEG